VFVIMCGSRISCGFVWLRWWNWWRLKVVVEESGGYGGVVVVMEVEDEV
jgi:hypothetical protein